MVAMRVMGLSRSTLQTARLTAFVIADGEERNVPEQVVAGPDHAIEPGLAKSEVGHEGGRVRLVELCDLELDLGADRHRLRRRA